MPGAKIPSQNQGGENVGLGQEAIQIYKSNRLALAKELLKDLGFTEEREQAGKLDIQRLEQVIDKYWEFLSQASEGVEQIFRIHYLHRENTSFGFENAPYPVKFGFIMFECVSDWITAAGSIVGEGPEFEGMVDTLNALRNQIYGLISPLKQCNSWEECKGTTEESEISGVQAVGLILHKFREIAGEMIAVKEAYEGQSDDQSATETAS